MSESSAAKKLLVPIESIKLWDKNPREISDKDFQSLKNKIKRWGIWKPFLVWESRKEILGGNQRYKACKDLGYKEVWVEYREPKNEAEALEMAIADNESSGEWIKSLLIEQIELHQEEINLEDYKINIKDSTLKDLMPIDVEEDNPPEEEDINTVSVLGDLYEINDHRVLCGDSTMIDQVEKLMNGKKDVSVLTDPPYNIGFSYKNYKDKVSDKDYQQFISDWFNIIEPVSMIITPGPRNEKYYDEPKDKGIWVKPNATAGASVFNLRLCEPILFYGEFKKKRPTDKFEFSSGFTKELKDAQINSGVGDNHPPAKSMSLWVELLKMIDTKTIVDYFLGNDTTLIACEKTERICYGMELDPHYCDVIVARYIKFMTDQSKPFTIKRNGEVIDPKIFLKDGKQPD